MAFTTVFNGVIYNEVLAKIILTFSRIPQYLAQPAIDILLIGVIISITYQGLEVIRGAGGANPILDVVSKNLRPLFVLTFALAAQQYSDFVLPIFKSDIPNLFINAANQAGGLPLLALGTDVNRVPFVSLDTNINAQLAHLKTIADEAKNHIFTPSFGIQWIYLFEIFGVDVEFPFPSLTVDVTGIPALLISGIVFIVIIVGAITVCLQAAFIVVAWSFVLAFGPMFIALYAFEITEKYALHWLESVLKYTFALIVLIILYNILASQLTAAMATFAAGYIANPKDVGAFMIAGMSPIVISIIGAYILTKAEHLSSDLIGGGVAGSGGFAASMSGKMSGAAGAVKGAAMGAAGKAMGAVKGAGGGGKSKGASEESAGKSKNGSSKNNPASAVLAAAMRNGRSR